MSRELDTFVAKYLQERGYKEALKGLYSDLGVDELPGIDKVESLEKILAAQLGIGPKFRSTDGTITNLPSEMLFQGLSKGKEKQMILVGALVISMTIWNNSTLIVSCSDKTIRFYSIETGELIRTINDLHGGSAVRIICKLNETHIITGGLDGRLLVSNFSTGEVCGIFKAHTRYVTSLDVYNGYVVSSGYDRLINVFKILDSNGSLRNMASLEIDSVPTSVKIALVEKEFIIEGNKNVTPPTSPIINGRIPVVIVCKQDSTQMFYYALNSLKEITKVNLCDADYVSDSFTPMDIALDEKRERYAVATNHIPYMRIITGFVGKKEIVNNLVVFSPQDKFSIPQLRWSNGGKGLWVIGDDGVLRAIQVIDGKLIGEFKGHEEKLRSLAIGDVEGKEIVITGGVDKKIVVWE